MTGIKAGTMSYKAKLQALDDEQEAVYSRMYKIGELLFGNLQNYPPTEHLYAEMAACRQAILDIEKRKAALTPWWRKFFQID